ncbi:zinc knuckle, partial [Cooperia oncophora]
MEAIIYGKPILKSVETLKSLIANFKEYAQPQKYSSDDYTQYEESLNAVDLIGGSIQQIECARDKLQSLIYKMKADYDITKNKDDRKMILQELEKLENEQKLTDVISEATELSYMLRTRLTEASSNENRLARKLGKYPRAQSAHTDPKLENANTQESNMSDGQAHRPEESRMQPIIHKRKEQQNTNAKEKRCVICEKSGHFPWQCRSPITVAERRKIAVEKRLCWKCYSSEHSSRECTRENCMLCGKLHHIRLCFSTENAGDANSNIRQTRINLNRSPKRDQLLKEEKQQPQTKTPIRNGNANETRRPKLPQPR